MILVTGGAGFIGSNFVLNWLEHSDEPVLNLDALTYAGHLASLNKLKDDERHVFVKGNILDQALLTEILNTYKPRAILHFAAESHVDRSIEDSISFLRTNVEGTHSLLSAALAYWSQLEGSEKENFRFLHVSTDEVYGSLNENDPPFSEITPYAPNSPYSASKASSDYFVRAWFHTYGLPVLTTNCSNNYGPYQFPEKLIPHIILNALSGQALPIYGDGRNIRDWLYVGDHCEAIKLVLEQGKPGETYNVGGANEKTNLDVVHTICDILDTLKPNAQHSYRAQIEFVTDRLGHDKRYAINPQKLMNELGWKPTETFATGIQKTVEWYLDNTEWIHNVHSAAQSHIEASIVEAYS